MVNQQLIADLSPFIALMKHVIQVTNWSGAHDNHGKPVLDNTTTRQYHCLIENVQKTSWNQSAATDGMPYVAYVASVPIGQSDAVAILKNQQMTIVTPSYLASSTPRRIGTIKSFTDQYGNLHNMEITFE